MPAARGSAAAVSRVLSCGWREGRPGFAIISVRLERFQVGAPFGATIRNVPVLIRVSVKTTGDPRIGSPVRFKALLAKAELRENIGVLVQFVLLEIIQKLTTAAGHLEQATAGVEILAVSAEMLGQVIDPGGEQRDLNFGRTGIGVVGFEFSDDFGLNDGSSGHGLVFELHDCRGPLQVPCRPPAPRETRVGRRHRFNPTECRTGHGEGPQPMDSH